MKKKLYTKLICGIAAAGLFFSPVAAFAEANADASSHSMDINANSKSKSVKSTKKVKKTTKSHKNEDDPFAELLMELLLMGWFLNNFTANYTDYPYCDTNANYIVHNFDSLDSDEVVIAGSGVTAHSSRFAFSADAFANIRLGTGWEACFEGILWHFIGPKLDFCWYGKDPSEMKGISNIGGQLTLFQTNYLSCSMFVQWTHLFGEIPVVLDTENRNGTSMGFDFRSYPVGPVVLQWLTRFGYMNNESTVFESNLQAGIMSGRTELFGGWKYSSVSDSEMKEVYNDWNCPYGGIRIYF